MDGGYSGGCRTKLSTPGVESLNYWGVGYFSQDWKKEYEFPGYLKISQFETRNIPQV
jgi:hypothetical protein